jgi:hypothetical protein
MHAETAFERATVLIPFLYDDVLPNIYCPLTGSVIHNAMDPEAGEEGVEDVPDWASIPTVTFYYVSLVGDFLYLRPDLADAIRIAREGFEDADAYDDFEILTMGVASLGRSPLVLQLKLEGIPAGRPSLSVYIGLDLVTCHPLVPRS